MFPSISLMWMSTSLNTRTRDDFDHGEGIPILYFEFDEAVVQLAVMQVQSKFVTGALILLLAEVIEHHLPLTPGTERRVRQQQI